MHKSNILMVCLHCVITCTMYSQTCVQQGNGKVTVIIQGDNFNIQVNFVENIRPLKILGSCPVTIIYRVTAIYRVIIYRFERITWSL